MDFLLDNALTQMNYIPTRSSSILDIFIADRPSLVESCDVVSGISDHKTLLVTSLVAACLSHPSPRTICLWSQADFDTIRNRITLLCEDCIASYTASSPVETLIVEHFLINL